MTKKKVTAKVLSQKKIGPDIYDLWMSTELAETARPGQFVCVYPKDKSALLGRPISICEVIPTESMMRLVYRKVGKGTSECATLNTGDNVELLGNLRNGFPADLAKGKKVFLIGGGVGIPPMVQLAKTIQGEKQIIVGYRNSETFLDKDLDRRGDLYIATEDGSLGTKGNVMDAIRENKLTADMIFACGPMPMLRAIKKYAEEAGIPAYISLEEHMACGIGACLGCVVKTAKKDPHSHVNNTRICTEGTVFEAQEVEI